MIKMLKSQIYFKTKTTFLPNSSCKKSQLPHFWGPHKVHIGIFSIFILDKYYFGQSLEREKKKKKIKL